jgi:hypothetical protein
VTLEKVASDVAERVTPHCVTRLVREHRGVTRSVKVFILGVPSLI